MHLKKIHRTDDIFLRPIVIAGPCSAETHQQVMDTAVALSKAGVGIFRGGIWP